MMPLFFVVLLLGGLQHPVVAAGLGALYTVARFFYFTGYATGVPANRTKIGCVRTRLVRRVLMHARADLAESLNEGVSSDEREVSFL